MVSMIWIWHFWPWPRVWSLWRRYCMLNMSRGSRKRSLWDNRSGIGRRMGYVRQCFRSYSYVSSKSGISERDRNVLNLNFRKFQSIILNFRSRLGCCITINDKMEGSKIIIPAGEDIRWKVKWPQMTSDDLSENKIIQNSLKNDFYLIIHKSYSF